MARGGKKKPVPFNPADFVDFAKSNPYVQQLLKDAKLRKDVRMAVASSKSAYARLSNGRLHTRALLEDKKLHNDLGRALSAARDVTITITDRPRRRRRRLTVGRVLVIGLIGTGVAMAASGKLRSKVLDMLFGAEEEFQYTPPPNSAASGSPSATVGAA